MKFTACESLDYRDRYTAKKEILATGKVFWMRPPMDDYDNPRMVQFCKKRGRLNHPDACTSEKSSCCSEYNEVEHDVDDTTIGV